MRMDNLAPRQPVAVDAGEQAQPAFAEIKKPAVAPGPAETKHFSPPKGLKNEQVLASLKQSKIPIGAHNLTDKLRAALVHSLPKEIARVVAVNVHPGLEANPFDFAALARNTSPEVKAALAAYVHPDFAFSDVDQKRAVLKQLGPVLLPKTQPMLKRFHLPRAFSEASGQKPVTLAIEAEAGIRGRPQTLDFYAPDPDGILDERIMTPEFFKTIEKELTPRPPLWNRLSTESRADLVRWKDLSYAGRLKYLERMKATTDPHVTLHRIENEKAAPTGKLAPETLRDQVKWEVSGALQTAELITKSHYVSRDQLCRDEAFIAGIGGKPPGFHYHCVLELDSAKDKLELGPKLAGLAAMTDLYLFTHDVRSGCAMLDHKHLEVFKADGVLEVMDAFAGDTIDSDEIMVHKYHLVGVRHGESMYGNTHRLGLEIRAVPVGRDKMGQEVVQRTLDIATSKALRSIDTDFWLEWNAGDKKLPKARYYIALATTKDPVLKKEARLTFEELFEYAMAGRKSIDPFRIAAPLWNYEMLPGMTDADKTRVRSARDRFETVCLQNSAALSVAIDSGRDILPEAIFNDLQRAVMAFYAEAKVDDVIKRHLDGLAEQGTK